MEYFIFHPFVWKSHQCSFVSPTPSAFENSVAGARSVKNGAENKLETGERAQCTRNFQLNESNGFSSFFFATSQLLAIQTMHTKIDGGEQMQAEKKHERLLKWNAEK